MVDRRDEMRIGGVVLAAGESTRFGDENKLLERIDGRRIIRQVTDIASEACLDDVIVIVGYESEAVEAALADTGVTIRVNEAYSEGQSTSVKQGVAFAQASGWDAAVFLLGDMPFVSPETVDRLIETYREGRGSIVAPRYDGVRGNPVLFGHQHFDTLANLTGDRGGRDLIEEHDGTRFVDTADAGIRRDIDTRAEFRDLTE